MPLTTHKLRGDGSSHRAKSVMALTTHQLRWRGEEVTEPISGCAPTHQQQGGRGRRVIEPIKCMRSPQHAATRWKEKRVQDQSRYRSPHTTTVDRRRGPYSQSSVSLPHTSYRWEATIVTEPIKCMPLTKHTSTVLGERFIEHQLYALTTHQLQVERRKRVIETIKCWSHHLNG